MIGQRLGPYEITAKLGEGGMGEVYRAHDTKLKRDVALKVLPAAFTEDKERLARFEREAQLLAQLNHPNIAAIHGLEEANGVRALVMELVEGPTLAERLEQGPLPFHESLSVSLQIAHALEEAHEKGIVHRDLKPQNIKASLAGKVKILDFGLAKAMDPVAGSRAAAEFANSPTITFGGTREGVILGTAAYMAPEQARGCAVDKRADIWAFGVVLYEMLAGERLFAAGSVVDILSAVMRGEIDLGKLPAQAPTPLRELVRRCLERDPKRRLRDIGEARVLLESLVVGSADDLLGPAIPDPTEPRADLWRRASPWLVALLGIAIGLASWVSRPAAREPALTAPVARFAIPLPAGAEFVPGGAPSLGLAISNDGRRIAYKARSGGSSLWLRRLDGLEIEPVDGPAGSSQPFFSPDGEWLAYFADGTLQKVSLRGGRPVTLARGYANAGWMLGTWCDDGTIVFDTWNAGLRAVDGNGGPVRNLTEPAEEWHLDPQALPGPCRVLFFTQTGARQSIELLSLADGGRRKLLDDASHGRVLASGHLLFVREGAVQIAPLDLERLELAGPAAPLPFEVVVDAINASAPTPQLAVARNGTLVYAPAIAEAHRSVTLVRALRDGSRTDLGRIDMANPSMQISPDGSQLALAGRRGGAARVESLDLARRATTKLVELATDYPAAPLWSLDGRSIFYARYGPREGEIVRHPIDGAGEDEVLVRMPGTWFCPWSISPDGRYLVFSAYDPKNGADLWLLDLELAPATQAVRPLVATAGSEYGAAISPDGNWFAYVSFAQEGGSQTLVERFPGGGAKTLVAQNVVGSAPLWSPDGRELYSTRLEADGLSIVATSIELAPTFGIGETRRLFSGGFVASNDMGRGYALAPDGRSFLLAQLEGSTPTTSYSASAKELVVVQNWFAELNELAAKLTLR